MSDQKIMAAVEVLPEDHLLISSREPKTRMPERVNILMVDDQPGKLLAHESVLADLGENVVLARSGREALEQLLKMEFAVILLDVNMPDMDGFETAALIRGRRRNQLTPIIFVTAYNTSDFDRLRGYDLGAVDYLFLPVIPEVLKAKVRVFVELARQKQIIERQAEFLAQHNRQQQEQIRTIQHLNQMLRAANEELESFSYSVSHDLRSPLRAMQGYVHVLIEDHKESFAPECEDYLKRISRAAVRMDRLIQDVLAYSRVSKAEITTALVDLNALLADILQENRVLKQAQARLSVKSPLLPVRAHEACLTQCLSNLLENAAKFVPKGVMPEITVWTEPRDSDVRIWIEDNGVGIEPAHQERIFQMFGRVYPETTYEGTGMGLTIVRKAAEKMGGSVGLVSALGMGSRFWIQLPAVISAEAETFDEPA